VISPTRELAVQIDQNLEGLAYHSGISSLAIYGGGDSDSWEKGKKAIQMEVDLIIATPGRLISHLRMGHLKLDNLKHLVLDEADRMLDMGFFDDIMDIIQYLPKNRQNLLFSATMPPEIRRLTKRILKEPVEINIAPSKPAEGILEAMYPVEEAEKLDQLKRLMHDKKDLNSVLIFSSTRKSVKEIGRKLEDLGLSAKAIHADLNQREREEILRLFKNKRLRILVATDLMSRGIDVDGIDLVINYTVPGDPEDYIHRIGRTARAESTGVALTFVSRQEARAFSRIERFLDKKIYRMPLS
jgi:superfamily II DNA/RNA helicase